MSVMTADPFEPDKDTALWSVAALFVAALHVGVVAAYLLLRPAPDGPAEAPVIDVAFMPAESTPPPAAPEPLPAEPTPLVEQSSIEPPKDEPVVSQQAAVEPEPPAMVEPAPQHEPPPLPPLALTAPEPAVEPPPADQLIVAPPPPKPAEVVPEASKPAAIPEHAARKPPPEEKEKAEREKKKAAPPKPAAAPASKPTRVALAPNSGAVSASASEGHAAWESELLAHIRRYATYAANGSRDSGTVRLGVTIDRNGRLLSRRIAGSSGSSALDSAAMSVIERAQPFPRFPAGMAQSQIALTIPLHLRPQ